MSLQPFESVNDSSALQLGSADNIAVAVRDIAASTEVRVNEHSVVLLNPVKVGHKFALKDIAKDERIVKYGAPIGRASRIIRAGEFVHTHNMESEYIPTYTLESGHRFVDQEPK